MPKFATIGINRLTDQSVNMGKMTDQSVNIKEKILETAFEIYISKPPQMVTVEEIAKAVGVSKGLIFYHFKDKDNLEKEVAFMVFKRLIDDSMDKVKTIDELIDLCVLNFSELPHLFNFSAYISGKVLYSGDYGLFKDIFDDVMGSTIKLFENEGVDDPKEMALAIMAIFDGLGLYSLFYDIGKIEDYGRIAKEFVKCRRLKK